MVGGVKKPKVRDPLAPIEFVTTVLLGTLSVIVMLGLANAAYDIVVSGSSDATYGVINDPVICLDRVRNLPVAERRNDPGRLG